MPGVQWGKLLLNLNNALNALSRPAAGGQSLAIGAGGGCSLRRSRRRSPCWRRAAFARRRSRACRRGSIPFILRLPDAAVPAGGAAHAGDRSGGALVDVGGSGAAATDRDRLSAGRDPGAGGEGRRGRADDRAHRAPRAGGRERRRRLARLAARRGCRRDTLERRERGGACDGRGRHRRRRRACRARRRRRAGRCRAQGDPARPGAGEQSLGGQAFWSFGGLLFVDSPEQRRMRIRDCHDLALQDWLGSAGFDREEDHWPRNAGPRPMSRSRPARSAPGCTPGACAGSPSSAGPSAAATRRPSTATRCRASTSPGARAPASSRHSCARVREGVEPGARIAALSPSRQRADDARAGVVDGVRGEILEPSSVERGAPSSRSVVGEFALKAQAVDRHLRRHRRQPRACAPELAQAPRRAAATHDLRRARPRRRAHARHHGSGRRQRHQPRPHVALHGGHPATGARSGSRHGIRILPGPSSMWLDARGRRLPVPLFPGFDTLGTLEHIMRSGLRLLLVRAQPEDHRARVRPVRLGAEPGPHQRQLAQGHPRAPRRRRAGAGARLHGEGRRFHRRARPWPTSSSA